VILAPFRSLHYYNPALEEYCQLDTQAMVDVLEGLRGL